LGEGKACIASVFIILLIKVIGEMIGKRPTMEDAFAIIGSYCDNDNWDFYAVFDGHAARFSSLLLFSTKNLLLIQLDQNCGYVWCGALSPSAQREVETKHVSRSPAFDARMLLRRQ